MALLLFYIPELLGVCVDWSSGKPSLAEMITILSKYNNLSISQNTAESLRQAL